MTQKQPLKGRSTGKGTKYAYLLEDLDVKRWYQNVARGSRITGDVYLRRVGNFKNETGLSPRELIGLNDKELSDRLFDYVSEKEDSSSPTYLAGTLRAIKSWLNFMGRPLQRQIKVHMASNARPTVENEKIPTQDELRKIILQASLRDRVCVIMMAHTGVRPQVLGSYMGDNGLRLRDFSELRIREQEIDFEHIPTLIRIPAALSKAGFQYLTFLSSEGCGYVKEYLESRLRGGERLSEDSSLITAKLPRKPFISSINISDAVRTPIRAAGFRWRPYVLRGYFDTQLLLAESKGKVAHDYRVFWMGHTGSMEARYTTNKNRLPADMVEDMRSSYERCQPFLQTIPTKTSEEDTVMMLRRELLKMAGCPEEEIAKMNLREMTDDEIRAEFTRRITGASNGAKQRIITISELAGALSNGWEFVSTIPGDKAVVRLY